MLRPLGCVLACLAVLLPNYGGKLDGEGPWGVCKAWLGNRPALWKWNGVSIFSFSFSHALSMSTALTLRRERWEVQ
ncbi:uncharacterized protein BDV14DRAFT_32082 [Aspergillus stella-maris]|uniref:uncharacterized protein n=1 Tax=Aspergillus stella-maris TaxID=1810926 RepID=UPI003CCC8FA2